MANFCPECGEEVEEDQDFCSNCGTELPDGESSESKSTSDEDKRNEETQDTNSSTSSFFEKISSPPKKKIGGGIIVITVLLLSVSLLTQEPLQKQHLNIENVEWIQAYPNSMDSGYYGKLEVTLKASEDAPRAFDVGYYKSANYEETGEHKITLQPGESERVTVKIPDQDSMSFFIYEKGSDAVSAQKLDVNMPKPDSSKIRPSPDTQDIELMGMDAVEFQGGENFKFQKDKFAENEDNFDKVFSLFVNTNETGSKYILPAVNIKYKPHENLQNVEFDSTCSVKYDEIKTGLTKSDLIYNGVEGNAKNYEFRGNNDNKLKVYFDDAYGDVMFSSKEVKKNSVEDGNGFSLNYLFYIEPHTAFMSFDKRSHFNYITCNTTLTAENGFTRTDKFRINLG